MNRHIAIRRLWWKELRQLLPLVGLLLLMGILLQAFAVLLPFGNRLPWRDVAALLGMPGLFAAGVGALLIGQEKEARTLDWLRSLPLAAGDLVRTKLLVALLGLLIVWSISFALGWATGAWDAIRDGHGGEFLWPLHSIFLLTVGFATAWRFRSSMIALLLVVPLASLPTLLATVHQNLVDWDAQSWRSWGSEPGVGLMAVYVTIFAAGFGWYGWRAGVDYLRPQAASRQPAQATSSASKASLSPLSYRATTPAPALLWQFLAQNRRLLLGLSVLLLVPLIFRLPVGIFGSLLAVCWLGACVFQGDVLQRRVLFLADRGVAPLLVWWTRQAVPFGLVLLGLLIVWMTGFPPELGTAQLLDSTMMFIVAALVLCIYLTSQWLGQIISSPIVMATAAPFFTLAAAAYFIYCSVELEASWWSIAVALLIPVAATGWGAGDWMDRRNTVSMWSKHIGLAVVFLVLPLTSFLMAWMSTPSMSSAARRELQSIIAQSELHDREPRELSLKSEDRQFLQETIQQQLSQHSGAIKVSNMPLICLTEAMRLRLIANGLSDENKREEMAEKYRGWLVLLVDLHDRLRMSWRLIDQDQADAIEMWLVEELRAESALERVGAELLDRIHGVLRNDDVRQAARRTAIALSWRRFDGQIQKFGGYNINANYGHYVTTMDVWKAGGHAGVLSELLLKSLDAKGEELAILRRRIGEIVGYSGGGEQQMYIKNAAGESQLLYFETINSQIPGSFWNGPWERQAAQLIASARNAP